MGAMQTKYIDYMIVYVYIYVSGLGEMGRKKPTEIVAIKIINVWG